MGELRDNVEEVAVFMYGFRCYCWWGIRVILRNNRYR